VRKKRKTGQHLSGADTGRSEQQDGRHDTSEQIVCQMRGAVDPVLLQDRPGDLRRSDLGRPRDMPELITRTAMTRNVGMRLALLTADGERLAARHFAPADGSAPTDPGSFVVVLAPGFSGWAEKPAVRQVAAELAESASPAGLLLVDLRGHGGSTGHSTLGDREVLDLDAAIATARALGYERVVTLGWSMGASCVLRHAGLTGQKVHGFPVRERTDAVVTVSAVSRWYVKDTAAMRRVHFIALTAPGRVIARRLLKVRIDPAGWRVAPVSPTEAAKRIDVPLLVVHGENDHYFDWQHAHALAEARGASTALWLVRGLGHAEEAAARPDVPGFLDQLGRALRDLGVGEAAPVWQEPAPTGPAIGGAA
jgi:pimeloyl-ACP methyl ester carboxylesterase